MADKPENLISDYLDGQLSADLRAQFEEQLRQDSQLRDLTQQLKRQSSELRSLPKFSLDSDFAERLMGDSRIDESFDRIASAETNVSIGPKPPRSVQSIRWKYLIGALTSLAALVVITAFLVLPGTERAASILAEKSVAESKDFAAGMDSSADVESSLENDRVDGPFAPNDKLENRDNQRNQTAAQLQKTPPSMQDGGVELESSDSVVGSTMEKKADRTRQQQSNENSKSKLNDGLRSSAAKSADPSRAISKDEASNQLADSLELSAPAREPFAPKMSANEAGGRVEAQAATDMENDESGDGLLDSIAQVDDDNVIEVKFNEPNQTVAYFSEALQQNQILLVENNQLAQSRSLRGAGKSAGAGGASGLPKNSIGAPNQPKAFLIEATDQQMAALVSDLQRRATVAKGKLNRESWGAQLKPSSLSKTLDNKYFEPADVDAMAADDSNDPVTNSASGAETTLRAIAREIDFGSAFELARSNEQEADSRGSRRGSDQASKLRKFVFLLQVDPAAPSSIDKSADVPAAKKPDN